jgi:CRP/FNR family transcriptional regulator, cyclic AMP receptor protein
MNEGTIKAFRKDEIIAREGDLSYEWFILMKGKIGVYRSDKLLSEFSERGIIFGELSGILSRPRTATMKAIEDSEVMIFDKNIDAIIQNHPNIARKIIINLAERLANTTNDLWSVIQETDVK